MRRLIVATIALVTSLPTAAFATHLVTFTIPGATTLTARSINDKGDVAGTFTDSNAVDHGFVRKHNGTLTTFDVGNTGTIAIGIAYDGVSTGWSTALTSQAFLRTGDGHVTTFTVPPGYSTTAAGINDNAEITGSYVTDDLVSHGYLRLKHGRIRTFDARGSRPPLGTLSKGINNSGDIVGVFGGRNALLGFIRKHDRTMITVAVPGAFATEPLAIDDEAAVAGTYQDNAGVYHGFVRDPTGSIETFDAVLYARKTQANAISNRGISAGYYIDQNNGVHGFVRALSGKVTPILLPDAGTITIAESVNIAGVVSGEYLGRDGVWRGFVLEP
jgi:uncharacterized membrane protein